MATREQVAEVLDLLMAAYPTMKIKAEPEQMVEVYHRYLQGMPPDKLAAATDRCAITCLFFPSVADICAAYCDLVEEENPPPTPGEALDLARGMFRKFRSSEYPGDGDWPHPLVGEAVAGMGGWRIFCMAEEERGAERFGKAYEAALARSRKRARALPYLAERKALGKGKRDGD